MKEGERACELGVWGKREQQEKTVLLWLLLGCFSLRKTEKGWVSGKQEGRKLISPRKRNEPWELSVFQPLPLSSFSFFLHKPVFTLFF